MVCCDFYFFWKRMPDIFPITDWQSFTASDFSELNVNPLPPDPQFGWLGWLVNQKFQLLVRARTSTSYSSPLGFPNLVDLSTTISIVRISKFTPICTDCTAVRGRHAYTFACTVVATRLHNACDSPHFHSNLGIQPYSSYGHTAVLFIRTYSRTLHI